MRKEFRCSRGARFGARRVASLGLAVGLSVLACQRTERPSASGSGAGPSAGSGGVAGGGGAGGAGTGGFIASEGGTTAQAPCNSWPGLCERRYDEIVQPVTHAAMANLAPPWDHPAQRRPLYRQLQDGIRGLMLEVHDRNGALTFCLGSCTEGRVPFSSGLDEVAMFLDSNPREVVTLIIDNRVPGTALGDALTEHGIARYLYDYPSGAPWPTLAEMIAAERRLVVFAFDDTTLPAGILPFWSFTSSTREDAATERDLDCDLVRGSASDPLMLVNHHVSAPPPAEDPGDGGAGGAGGAGGEAGMGEAGDGNGTQDALARRALPDEAPAINANPFLIQRLRACAAEHGRTPTFLAVDFYDQGDVLAATQELNGLIPLTGP